MLKVTYKNTTLYIIFLLSIILGISNALIDFYSSSIGLGVLTLYLLMVIFLLYRNDYEVILYNQNNLTILFYIVLVTVGNIQYLLSNIHQISISYIIFYPIFIYLIYILFNTVKREIDLIDILNYFFLGVLSILFYKLCYSFF